MARGAVLLAVLALSACVVAGCQGSGIHGASVPPLPSQLDGPNSFQLPMFRWNPERETVHRQACASEQGTDETISHSTGVRRHENGLTEVRLETNGEEFGRVLYGQWPPRARDRQ